MESKEIVKVFVMVATIGFALYHLIKKNYLYFGLLLILAILFYYVLFKKAEEEKQHPMSLETMIALTIPVLEDTFKITVGRDGNFRLLGHNPAGQREYRIVFEATEDTGETKYFPVTIDRYDRRGIFGEGTGTAVSRQAAEWFLVKDTGISLSKPLSIEDLELMMERQKREIEETYKKVQTLETTGGNQ